VGAIEGISAIRNGFLNSLSVQQFISCDDSNNGCNVRGFFLVVSPDPYLVCSFRADPYYSFFTFLHTREDRYSMP